MNNLLKLLCVFTFILISTIANSQSSEIIKLDEKNSYEYKRYYEDGSLKSIIGFYSKKPFPSTESFESKLKDYKVKYHGKQKEYYQNGQLKEIVIYKKGKVIEYLKQYFEDGEEYSVNTEDQPGFQFKIQEYNIWFNQRIQEIENKYKINLVGKGIIALDISKDGTIKSIKVRVSDETQKKYLVEIGEQIKVVKPAKKNGQDIGTRFAFKIEL